MKTITILLFAGLIVFTACGQKKEVPTAIKNTFQEKYPDAKKVEYEFEKDSWEVEFKMNKDEYEAEFTVEGEWIETEHEIKKVDIPTAIKVSIEKDYAGYEIDDAVKSETPEGTFYEIELEGNNDKEIEVRYSPDGKLVQEKEDNESKDEEDD